MSTRAVVYVHFKDEDKADLPYTMKLYHHYDGYIDWLWASLDEILLKFKGIWEGNNCGSLRDLFSLLAQEWGFEPTCWFHWDTEYIYHVYINPMWNGDKRFDYQLCVQVGEDTKEKWDKDKVVVSEDWNFHKKEFNPLETEKEIQKMFYPDRD